MPCINIVITYNLFASFSTKMFFIIDNFDCSSNDNFDLIIIYNESNSDKSENEIAIEKLQHDLS